MSGSIMGSWQSSGTRLDTEVSGLGIYIGIPIIWQVQTLSMQMKFLVLQILVQVYGSGRIGSG